MCGSVPGGRNVLPYSGSFWQVEPPPGAGRPGIIERLYISTDGTLAAENRVRTEVANLVPNALVHSSRDLRDRNEFFPTDVARLASIGCLFMLLVGALALAAGMIAGLLERRRSFALLRASGVRIGELRRVVFLETAATVVFTSALGLGMGLLLSYVSISRDGAAGSGRSSPCSPTWAAGFSPRCCSRRSPCRCSVPPPDTNPSGTSSRVLRWPAGPASAVAARR